MNDDLAAIRRLLQWVIVLLIALNVSLLIPVFAAMSNS